MQNIHKNKIFSMINEALVNNDAQLINKIIENIPIKYYLTQESISTARQDSSFSVIIFLCTLAINNNIEKDEAEFWLNVYQSIINKKICPYFANFDIDHLHLQILESIISNTEFSPSENSIYNLENHDLTAAIELLYDLKKWSSLIKLINLLDKDPALTNTQSICNSFLSSRNILLELNKPKQEKLFCADPLFEVIISGINIEKYIDKCLNSVIQQEYKNYRIHILSDDDPNKIATNSKSISKFNIEHKQLKIFSSETRKGKAALIFDYFQNFIFEENSVAVILDCDDTLLRKSSLSTIASAYINEQPDACWSSYVRSDNVLGHSAPLINGFNHRQQGWRSSHCFTFKAKLLQKIPREYICDSNGNPVMQACDIAIALPILDIAKKTHFIPEALYYYNVGNPESHHNQNDGFGLSSKRQHETAQYLYKKDPLRFF